MTWFGPVSAWAAAIVGVTMLVLAGFQFMWDLLPWFTLLGGVLLLVASFRTLRAMSGGLRLLAGAWGLAAGLLISGAIPVIIHRVSATDLNALFTAFGILPWIALAGLALTVLHKEQKK